MDKICEETSSKLLTHAMYYLRNLENPMATGSEDMQTDNNLVIDVEEFNPVNTDNVEEQENGAISLNDIEENPQLLDVRSCLYESRDRTGHLPGRDVFHPVFIWE